MTDLAVTRDSHERKIMAVFCNKLFWSILAIRILQEALASALNEWLQLVGAEDESTLHLEISKDDFDLKKLKGPKVGRFDKDNAPHSGGGTWAGGTGGYNTAGLGGIGGPYR